MFRFVFLATSFAAASCLAQQVVPYPAGPAGSTFNRTLLTRSRLGSGGIQSHTVVGTSGAASLGNLVLPHVIDGASWQTSITMVNLETHGTSFDLLFFQDNGTDFPLPINGHGSVNALHIALAALGSTTIDTEGLSPSLLSGWAMVSQPNGDAVGVSAIFRSSQPGRQPQEAVVPTTSQFTTHFVIPFDNTVYATGIALANPSLNVETISATIRDESGNVIDRRNLSIVASGHFAMSVGDAWSTTVGKRGTIEFQTSGTGLGGLGLRFNGAAFTTLDVYQNAAWTQ